MSRGLFGGRRCGLPHYGLPCSHGYRRGSGASGGGGYRPRYYGSSYSGGYSLSSSRSTPTYTQEAMGALQAAIAQREAADQTRLASQQYGGHPLQQERPELQYQTVQTDNRAEYYRLTQAQEYQQRHEQAGAGANALHKLGNVLNGNPNP